MHGIAWRDVGMDALAEALGAAVGAGGTHVLRVRTERAANQRRHVEVAEAVARGVREALQE